MASFTVAPPQLAQPTLRHRRFPTTSCRVKPVQAHQAEAPAVQNAAAGLAHSLTALFKLQIESHFHKTLTHDHHHESPRLAQLTSLLNSKVNTPTASPKENISEKWREIHGHVSWKGLLNPFHPWLRRELVKYGELAQATYDAFDFDPTSEYCGSCRYGRGRMFEKLGMTHVGYDVSKYVYAMSHVELPRWMERSKAMGDKWSEDSNWIGYVAVSNDEETARIGRRDIVVAWRGTVAPSEWYEDFQQKMEIVGTSNSRVEHGFLSLYTSKSEATRYNKSSASEQVMGEIVRLLKLYKSRGEEVSITITGHSLGGALALLNAYEAATVFPDVHVSVVSFGAPRVGNTRFKQELQEKGVRALRVVVKQDVVPRMPGIIFNDESVEDGGEWVYAHAGLELKLDAGASPYLKQGMMHLQGHHMLETYLHLVDGFGGCETAPFRVGARRDVALVNKECDMLVSELGVPPCWHCQVAYKGLVRNEQGRWVRPARDPQDIPSPVGGSSSSPHLARVLYAA